MANSTTNLDLLQVNQSGKEETVNALFDPMSPSALYGRRENTTMALTWGYYGGNILIGDTTYPIANGTITLTNNATNYVEMSKTDGTISVNTTGWATSGKQKLYSIVTASNLVTSYTDYRAFLKIAGTDTYTLPTASTTTLGGVKVDGTTITINENGVISSVSGSSLTIKDEGNILTTAASSINFVGSGVTATANGNNITVNINSGGGSGGSNAGSSVIRGNSFKNANGNADWSHYTVVCKLDSSKIINACNSFKVKLLINSNTTQCKIGAITIKKTLPNSTSVIGSSSLTINNNSSPVLSLTAISDNYFITDECNFSIDLYHDYYIFVYFISDTVNTQLMLKQGSPDGDLNSEYSSGDLTSATTISQNTFGYALLFKQIIIVS